MTRPPDSSDPTIITRGLRTSPVVAEPDEPTWSIVPATTSGIEAATSGIDAATSPGFEAAATSSGFEATTSDPASDRRFDATEAGLTSTPQPASAWTVQELSPEWTSPHEPVGSTEQKSSPDWTSPEWTSPVAAGPSTSAWPEAAAGPVPDVSDHAYDATAYRPYEQTYSATQIRTDHSDVGYGGPSGYDGYAAPDVYPGGGSDVHPAAGPDFYPGVGADPYAGAGADPYAGAGSGLYAGGVPPGYAGGAPPPQPGHSRGSIVAIALTAVVVIAIVGVAYYIVAGTGGGTSGTTAGPRNGSTDITACATAPSGTVTELRPQTELTAVLSVRAGCDSGDVLSSPDTRITLRSGSALVAAASFDLSRSPVAIGDAATLTVVFPADSSYVIRKALPSASAVTVEIAGAGGSTREASTAVSAVSLTGGRRALPPGTDGDDAAASALRALITAGEPPAAQELGERWVPQLSAKRVGLFADGRTWTNETILDEVRRLDARFGVYLLDSARWPVFDSPIWFVTVAAVPMATPELALGWCRQQGFDADHCYAKRLSKTSGPTGSSKYQ